METQLPPPWGDVSRFAFNSEKYVDQQAFLAKFGPFNLVLTRHSDYANGQWATSCHGVFSPRMIIIENIHDAANQAEAILLEELEAIISKLKKP